jgi:hypothetical protein
VTFEIHRSSGVLERLADAVVSGRIVAPPITRIKLDDVEPYMRQRGKGSIVHVSARVAPSMPPSQRHTPGP